MNQREIAKLAGVSTATVSRVVNGDVSVAKTTKEHVLKIIDQYSYVQNINARNLRASRSKAIGFLISNFSNPFFIEVYKGLEPVCRKKGYSIIIGNTNESVEQEKEAIDLFLRYRVDGMIASFVEPKEDTLRKLRNFNMTIIQLDRTLKNLDSDVIVIDNVTGSMEQVETLARLGHERIAVIKGMSFDSNGVERLSGFMEGMKKCGLAVRREYVVSGDFLEENAYNAAIELMHLPTPPTAIICHNNLMCIGAYKALMDMRIEIPRDVSLIGFDDFELSEHLQPSLTLIDRPIKEMGEMAGKMIIDRIEGEYKGEPRRIVFPVKLRFGGSCGAPQGR